VERVKIITVAAGTSIKEFQKLVREHEATFGILNKIARVGKTTRLTFTRDAPPAQPAVVVRYESATTPRKRGQELFLTGLGLVEGQPVQIAVYRSRRAGSALGGGPGTGRGRGGGVYRGRVEFEANFEADDIGQKELGGGPRSDDTASADPHGWGGGRPG